MCQETVARLPAAEAVDKLAYQCREVETADEEKDAEKDHKQQQDSIERQKKVCWHTRLSTAHDVTVVPQPPHDVVALPVLNLDASAITPHVHSSRDPIVSEPNLEGGPSASITRGQRTGASPFGNMPKQTLR